MSILRNTFLAMTLGAFALGATACGGSDTEASTMPEDPAEADEGMDDFDDDYQPCGDMDDFDDGEDAADEFDQPCGDVADDEDW